ncbi:hypothetical protein ACA910_000875 [Epithemia clementina (nom. ined.)]
MIAAPWLWIGGLLASAVVTHHVLKPRLPVYIIHPLIRLPRFAWDEDNQAMLGLPMSVRMHNDNYMEIDVYSLTFDMFYMNHAGDLLHVADIKDHSQVEQKRSNPNSTKPVLWQIPSRSNFTIDDTLYISLESSLLTNLLWNTRFYSSLWHGSGSFWLPTTGVAHVKATQKGVAAAMPATISIVCDNFVENLIVQGLSCVLHDAQPGWAEMKKIAQSLKTHALTKLHANSIGVVLELPKMKS